MSINSSVYIAAALVIVGGIPGLFFWGIEKMDYQAFTHLREQQIQAAQIDPGHDLAPVQCAGGIVLVDYFKPTVGGYQYFGGMHGSSWKVGKVYSLNDLKSSGIPRLVEHRFYGQKTGENDFYINIDRGDENAPGDFLKLMDHHGGSEIDTLVIDFRFLRTIDFGSMLRLFNQIAPPRKIVLGMIIDSHQEEVIMSSGHPFFTSNQTIFLVDEKMPDPVKLLVTNLGQLNSYRVIGDLGQLNDSVCLVTPFEIGDKKYRVCTAKWTNGQSDSQYHHVNETMVDSIRMKMLDAMDEVWYKRRDTIAMVSLVPAMLSDLLP